MPIQYGQYQLSNSRQVRPFAGSVLPELTSVAGTLQERYDKALENEDLLSRATRIAQAAPFSQDQQLLEGLKQEFKERINQRATRGDYENMYRETMLDARNFMDRYQPLVENAQRFEAYKNSLNEAVAKGDIKSPDKARKLLTLATNTYQGLSYDPVTGQYGNKFQGLTPVKDIDPTEKVDKWMKDVAPTVIGKETKYVDGMWMKYVDNKWTTLTPQEINQVISAGRRLDPEFNAWMNQEKLLSTADTGKISLQAIEALSEGPIKNAILQGIQKGASPAQAAGAVMGSLREQDIYNNMQQYANKYIRDDKQLGSGISGPNQFELSRFNKKLEDEAMVLSMPILQPETRATINGAEDLLSKIGEAGTARQAAQQNFENWVTTNQVRPDGKGNWVDANGNDKTLKYLEQKQVFQQAQKAWEDLQKLDAEARKRTGYNPGKSITPALMKEAERAGAQAAERYKGLVSEGSGGFSTVSPQEYEQARQRAKAEYLRLHAPGYTQYDKILKDMTEAGAQVVNAQTFTSKEANKQATDLFKGLVLNLDAKGLNAGPVGLTWAMGPKAGKPLEDEDYKQVAADAVFAGYAMDTDGQLKYYYNVGKVTQNAKGELVGSQSVVKMPALPGTAELLIKTKQMDPMQIGLGQQINQTINNPSGQGYIDIDGRNKIFVDRIDKTEIGNQEVAAGLNLRIPAPGGKYTEVRVNSVGEAINMITNLLQRNMQKQNK